MKIKFIISICIISSMALLTGCYSYDTYNYNSNATATAPKAKKVVRPAHSMPASRTATGSKTFVFDPKRLMWGAYDKNGKLINDGYASGGKGWCSDIRRPCRTPTGSFRVTRKGDASCKSSKFPIGKGGAPMPHCTFFRGGYAIHGSYDVPAHNASHGCIRVQPADASWLSGNFLDIGTRVVVKHY